MDHAGDALFIIDENAKFVDVNAAACQRLGYSREELLPLGVADVDLEFPIEEWGKHWEDVKASGPLTLLSGTLTAAVTGCIVGLVLSAL